MVKSYLSKRFNKILTGILIKRKSLAEMSDYIKKNRKEHNYGSETFPSHFN